MVALAKGDNPNRKTSVLQDYWGLGVGVTIPPRLKNIVTKSEEVKNRTGLLGTTSRKSLSTETNGHNFLRRPGPTRGCPAFEDDGDDAS
jgi:hypothetical protein